MNGQLALFIEPQRLARRLDPVTSHKAAEKAERFIASHEAVVFGAICEAGSHGATAKEIARVTGLTDVQVNRRLGAMGKRGLIERNPLGDYEGMEQRGGCAVWRKA